MKTLFATAACLIATALLGACSGTAEPAASPADANPTGLVISNARLLLPPVPGNPAAVYFDVKNEGKRAVAVRRADIAGAKTAAMHDMMEYDFKKTMADMGPLTIPAGQTVAFAPGGKHVMAMDLSPGLRPGGKTELTLTVAGGDKVSAEIPVMAAGADR